MKITKTTIINKTEEFMLSCDDIKELLIKNELIDLKKKIKEICIYVNVPGGGDWSNTLLEIGDHTPSLNICIKYAEEVT